MARTLRSAGFTPQELRAELSSNGFSMRLRGARLTPHFHAELPSNLSMEQAGGVRQFGMVFLVSHFLLHYEGDGM